MMEWFHKICSSRLQVCREGVAQTLALPCMEAVLGLHNVQYVNLDHANHQHKSAFAFISVMYHR